MLMFTSLVDGRVRTVTNCITSRRATVTPHPTCSWKSQDSNLLSPKAPVLQTGPALQRWRTSLWKRMGSNHHLPGFNRPLYPRAALPRKLRGDTLFELCDVSPLTHHLAHITLHTFLCCQGWTRTSISGSKNRGPAVRRPGIVILDSSDHAAFAWASAA